MHSIPIPRGKKSKRYAAIAFASILALVAPTAYAAEAGPSLSLGETATGTIVASGKKFPASASVDLTAVIGSSQGTASVETTQTGRFLVGFEIADGSTGTLTVTAKSGTTTKTATKQLGSVSAPTTTAAPKTTETVAPKTTTAPKKTTSGNNRSGLPFELGVFAHSAERVVKFEEVTGHKVDVLSVSPARDGGWSSIMDSWWMENAPPGFTGSLDVSVPLWPIDGDVGTAASGGYNSNWEELGKLIASKYPNSYVRPGWEFNIQGWPWAANEGNADQWIKAVQQAATSLRKAAPTLKIEWNPNAGVGDGLSDATKVYPGDEYVDVVGLDSYDWDPGVTDASSWEEHLNGTGGFNYWMDFARKHGKTFSLPEWGVVTSDRGNTGGDNPLFMNYLMDWLGQNADNVAHVDYFDEPDDYLQSSLAEGQAPKALAAFKAKLDALSSGEGVGSGSSSSSSSASSSSESSEESATEEEETSTEESSQEDSSGDSDESGGTTWSGAGDGNGHGPLPS